MQTLLNVSHCQSFSWRYPAVPDSLHSLQRFAYKKVELNFAVWLVGNKSYNNLFLFFTKLYWPLVKTQHPRELELTNVRGPIFFSNDRKKIIIRLVTKNHLFLVPAGITSKQHAHFWKTAIEKSGKIHNFLK